MASPGIDGNTARSLTQLPAKAELHRISAAYRRMANIPGPDTEIVFRDGFSSPSPKETGCKVRGSDAPDFFGSSRKSVGEFGVEWPANPGWARVSVD
jgi:hypothetical protein